MKRRRQPPKSRAPESDFSYDSLKASIIEANEAVIAEEELRARRAYRALTRVAQVASTASTISPHPAAGAMMVLMFLRNPPTFVMVLDQEEVDSKRNRWGFVYGGQDEDDAEICDTAHRECMEEARVETEFDQGHIIAKHSAPNDIPGEPDYISYIFFKTMPPVPIAPGTTEQAKVCEKTREEINELIAQKKVKPKHAKFWAIVEELVF